MVIEWRDDTHGIGVERIDAQHRVLVTLINEMGDASDAGAQAAQLRAVLQKLVSYAGYHFRTEEELMLRHGYPLASSHVSAHARLSLRTHQIYRLCDSAPERAGPACVSFLGEWINEHVLRQDRDLGRFLNAAGVH